MKLRHNGWMDRVRNATTRKELYDIMSEAVDKMSEKSYSKLLDLCEARENQLGLNKPTEKQEVSS